MAEQNHFARFSKLVFADAAEDSARISREVDARRSQTLQEAEQAQKQKLQQVLQAQAARLEAEAGRKLSHQVLENNRSIATRREAMAAEVFAAVRQKLLAFHDTPAYEQELLRLYRQAFAALGNPYDAVIYLRQDDLHLDSQLARLLPGRHVEFQAGNFQLGGLIMDCRSRMQRVDLSYDTALGDLDGHFAELFGLRLSDE